MRVRHGRLGAGGGALEVAPDDEPGDRAGAGGEEVGLPGPVARGEVVVGAGGEVRAGGGEEGGPVRRPVRVQVGVALGDFLGARAVACGLGFAPVDEALETGSVRGEGDGHDAAVPHPMSGSAGRC